MFEKLSPPYKTIVADPPWRYASAATKASVEHRYSVMTTDNICEMPVESLAEEDAHLWLWVVNLRMEDGHRIVRAWGFNPTTIVTWCKPGPGVGYYLRNNTEHLIFATKGKPMVPEDKPLSTWYNWPRGVHSVKPSAAGDLIESVSPGPYLELFARAPRLGWDSWGYGFEESGRLLKPEDA
jgi:N6-adenosine-specific RNA methylase IME4